MTAAHLPVDEVQRYLVYLKNWTLNLAPLMVYPKVLFPLNFIVEGPSHAEARLKSMLQWA